MLYYYVNKKEVEICFQTNDDIMMLTQVFSHVLLLPLRPYRE